MSILLTGATGFIGSAVLRKLRLQGREVTAIVRSPERVAKIEALGARAIVGDLSDARQLLQLEQLARDSDGVIHIASPGDATSRDIDDGVVTAVLTALANSGKRYVHTSGIWIWGDNDDISEDSPENAPPLTAWRSEIEQRVRNAPDVSTTIIVPAVVFGHGSGIPTMFTAAAEKDQVITLIGDGSQHWTSVHVDDLAELYLLAFDLGEAGTTYIGASGENPTVREIGEAAAVGQRLDSVVQTETVAESRERLSIPFADALLLDQQARGTAARIDLGWEPNGPTLIEELRTGSYAIKD